MIVLEIIGGLVLVIVVILFIVYVYFKVKYGKYLSVDVNNEPLSINLYKDASPDWLDDKGVKTIVNELEEIGYISGPAYCIYEMEDVLLQPFFKECMVAVVYSHKIAGHWIDILIQEIEGGEYTFSNAPMGGGMEQRPECKKLFDSKAGVSELHGFAEEILKNSEAELLHMSETNFREYFESAYKKDIAWKNRKGGITFEEFSKTEKEAPFSNSKKSIEQAFVLTKLNELNHWHEASLEEYRKANNIKDEEFWEVEQRLFIVPFKSHAMAFLEYLEERGFINEVQLEKYQKVYRNESDIFDLFEKINDLYSPKLRARFIGEYSFPLGLKIFQMSEDMH